jgi:hypothetical protein
MLNVRPFMAATMMMLTPCMLLGCGHTEGTLRPAAQVLPVGMDAKDAYRAQLRTWTRKDQIYQGLDNKLFISATYHAAAFRRAFAIAFPDIYGHGGKITRRELVDMTDGVEQHHNFFIATYTPVLQWNDFSRDDSIWRITLYSKAQGESGLGEAQVSPDDIIPLKVDENLRAVYPYISRFDKIYLVRFPLVDALQRPLVDEGTGEVVMRVASALGVATMRWGMHALGDGRPVTADEPSPMTHDPHSASD